MEIELVRSRQGPLANRYEIKKYTTSCNFHPRRPNQCHASYHCHYTTLPPSGVNFDDIEEHCGVDARSSDRALRQLWADAFESIGPYTSESRESLLEMSDDWLPRYVLQPFLSDTRITNVYGSLSADNVHDCERVGDLDGPEGVPMVNLTVNGYFDRKHTDALVKADIQQGWTRVSRVPTLAYMAHRQLSPLDRLEWDEIDATSPRRSPF